MAPSRRAWQSLLTTAGVVVAVVALTGGVALLGHRATTTGPFTPEPVRSLELTLAYVGRTPAGPKLFTETHAVPDPQGPALTVAVAALTSDWPHDDDYRNYLLASHTSATASEQDGTIVIDFRTTPRRGPDMDDAIARMALQAVVRTVDDAVGDAVPVRFRIAAVPTHPPSSAWTPASPCAPRRPATVDSPVEIDSPVENGSLASGASVRGRASTADGRVYWAVYRNSGLVLVGKGRSAAGRSGEFTPYSFTLPALAHGQTYVLVVGTGPNLGGGGTVVDTKEFSVH